MMRGDVISQVGPQPRRLRFSVDHYYKMIEMGMLENYEKAEIIDGELVQKITIGDRHAAAVNALTLFFVRNVSDLILVSVQNPLRLSDFDEPEPDIVLADLTKYDGKRHPRPAETILVVEVADASLKYDRDTKLVLYAEAEIPEVWDRKSSKQYYRSPYSAERRHLPNSKNFQAGRNCRINCFAGPTA